MDAFCTTGTTITLVGLDLGKIFISRLAHYKCNENLTGSGAQLARSTTTTVKKAALQQCVCIIFIILGKCRTLWGEPEGVSVHYISKWAFQSGSNTTVIGLYD